MRLFQSYVPLHDLYQSQINHILSSSHFLSWGSMYMAYLEIQTSNWWYETCSRLNIWFCTSFHFQIPNIYTFIWNHIIKVDQYIEQVICMTSFTTEVVWSSHGQVVHHHYWFISAGHSLEPSTSNMDITFLHHRLQMVVTNHLSSLSSLMVTHSHVISCSIPSYMLLILEADVFCWSLLHVVMSFPSAFPLLGLAHMSIIT